MYEEELSHLNPDFVAFHYGGPGLGAAVPGGLNPAHVYSFGAMSTVDYQRLMHPARTYAAELRVTLGLPPIPGPAPGPAGAPAAVAQTVWVALEMRGNIKQGTIVVAQGQPLPAGSVSLGDRAFTSPCSSWRWASSIPWIAETCGSCRLSSIRKDNVAWSFPEAVSALKPVDMPGGKLQLSGGPSFSCGRWCSGA